ncbi:DUF5320 domain-containing protein [Clostridium ganghwense]|uniref:DUF5320 domain-containing protein n=1 Tax=Clostridium ganghwense TaxID=312089 RepID=A0ABT4CWI4_9CLOT|nr:DUF5320 domain-containing protein [Clostridium ganghwense]MCY6372239.1 DUF5320 domain-containing protein [Clostridium ganghwense]
MAGLNGMGPFEEGPMTGRGFGRRYRVRGRDFGRCFNWGRGFGNWIAYEDLNDEEKKSLLKREKDLLEEKLKVIEEKLKMLGDA